MPPVDSHLKRLGDQIIHQDFIRHFVEVHGNRVQVPDETPFEFRQLFRKRECDALDDARHPVLFVKDIVTKDQACRHRIEMEEMRAVKTLSRTRICFQQQAPGSFSIPI